MDLYDIKLKYGKTTATYIGRYRSISYAEFIELQEITISNNTELYEHILPYAKSRYKIKDNPMNELARTLEAVLAQAKPEDLKAVDAMLVW